MYEIGEEAMERIGDFINDHVRLPDGSLVPRNLSTYQEAFKVMLESGRFLSTAEIRRACLRERYQMIPFQLLEGIEKYGTQPRRHPQA